MCVLNRSVVCNSLWPPRTVACQAPLSVGILQARILEWVVMPSSWWEPRSPALQADSLPSEPPRKTKNTRVGSLSLLQWVFPTQESNWGLLHCRHILFHLSYQWSPYHIAPCLNSFPAFNHICDYFTCLYFILSFFSDWPSSFYIHIPVKTFMRLFILEYLLNVYWVPDAKRTNTPGLWHNVWSCVLAHISL